MAIIFAVVIGFGSYFSGELFYGADAIEQHSYVISTESDDDDEASNKEPEIEQIESYLAEANLKRGKKLFKKCKACHTIKSGGKNKTGPNLFAIVGAEKARSTFAYSDGMRSKGGVWTVQHLSEFLTKPKAFIVGTKMSFAGFKNVEDRADIIAYLQTFE